MAEPLYILSPWYRLVPEEELDAPASDAPESVRATYRRLRSGEQFLLRNEFKGKAMLITPVMRHFLEYLHQPCTLRTIIEGFAEELRIDPKVIGKKVYEFFDDMVHRGVIVRPREVAELQERLEANEEPTGLYRPGDAHDDYLILDDLSLQRDVELYHARHRSTGQEAVLKIYTPPARIRPKRLRRKLREFRHEFDLLAKLQDHPAVVRLYDFVEHDRHPYAVIEYIPGRGLRRYLAGHEATTAERLQLADEAVDMVAHLHRRGILHGDLHGSNFRRQDNGRLRLIDFDLANHVTREAREPEHQGGVHDFLPPERLSPTCFERTSGPATLPGEVYQLGVALFYILFNRFPFEGFTLHELAECIKTAPPAYPEDTDARLREHYAPLIERCLAKQPTDRFADATEVEAAWQSLKTVAV